MATPLERGAPFLRRLYCKDAAPFLAWVAMDVREVSWVRRLARTGGARVIREGAGFSAAEVARELGVAPSTVIRWERGERLPRAEAAHRYAQLLKRLSR